ncbi:hypothetical protein ACF0H5_022538 [Mactra antiquata]
MSKFILAWMLLLRIVDGSENCSSNCKTCYSGEMNWVCMSCYNGTFLKRYGAYYECHQCDPGCITCEYHGSCGKCVQGAYGKGCEKYCSNGCLDGCDKSNGYCTCMENFSGEKCWDCVNGRYGNNCSLQCSSGCLNNICHKMNGQCECRDGFTGLRCDQCIEDRYGPSCQYNCSQGCYNSTCDQITGNCTCMLNYTGDQCDTCIINLQQYINTNCGTTCPDECGKCEISQNINTKEIVLCKMIQFARTMIQYIRLFI